jgi:hypothetical protein
MIVVHILVQTFKHGYDVTMYLLPVSPTGNKIKRTSNDDLIFKTLNLSITLKYRTLGELQLCAAAIFY